MKPTTISPETFFNDLLEGLQDGVEWAQGKKALRVSEVVDGDVLSEEATGPEVAARRNVARQLSASE